MRGNGRSSGGRGRGRGRHARDLSPHRSRGPRRSLSPDRRHLPPHRTTSPVLGRAQRRSMSRDRDYHLRDRDYALRGKQVHHRHDEGQENFYHKYMLPDHSTDLNSNANPNMQSNRSAKDEDFMAPSGINDGQGLLPQKSMFLGDGFSRTYYSRTQENLVHPVDPHALNPLGSMRSNLGIGAHHYHEQTREPYDDLERDKAYPKVALFSEMMPPVQPRPLVGGSSSSFLKDGSCLGFYGDRDGVGKYADDPLKYNDYSQVQLSEPLKRGLLSPWAREDQLDYGYNELGRGRDDPLFIGLESTNREVPWRSHSEYRDVLGSSRTELAEERVDASRKNVSESSFWDLPASLHGESALDFRDLKGGREDYSRSVYVGHRMESSRDHEVAPFEEGYSFGRDVAPMAYRQGERSCSPLLVDHHRDMLRYGVSPPLGNPRLDGRTSSPLLVDHHMDMVRHGVSPHQGNSRFDDDLDMYDRSPERMARRKYVMNDHGNGLDSRGMLFNDRNIHRRIRMQSPTLGDEMWSTEEDRRVLPSSTHKGAYGRHQYRMPSHRFSRNDQALSNGSYTCAEDGRVTSLKKRLRSDPSESHVLLSSQRRQVLPKPHKIWKRGPDDRHVDLNAPVGDANSMKIDPPENSMEFKQQVHKAFLRFSKLLNESPHQKKRYRDDQGRSSNLLCRVCGSFSKEFVDTHSLLTHTYHSLKPGLRTEHLGFHKALCVLMGWNWLVSPDTSKSYMTRCDTEVKALKEDLILWPPIVVINNSSIGNRNNTNTPKVISIEGMEEILKGMGFDVGKCKICGGKPANQSVVLFKFPATFSGLQEAERLHKYYADKKRGREEFQKFTSSNGSTREAPAVKEEELLYGYMAIVEDLDKLDPETKKRCHVKSRKDIEAIADAPLDAD